MTWFFAVVIVAVMGGIAVVATGRGGSMAEAYDDRPDARVPVDGPLTAHGPAAGAVQHRASAATGCRRWTRCWTGSPPSCEPGPATRTARPA